VGEEGAPQESRDYRTALTKIKALNPDYLYMPLYPEGGIVAVNQASELGITTKMFGADAGGDPKFQKEVSGKADILYTEPKTGSSDEFKAKVFAKTGGDQVPIGTANAYDNLKILAQVMSEVGTDPDKIQEALRAIDYKGVSGDISFDENGDVKIANYVVKRIQDGGAVEVSTQ
jgi:branched-chain amino acid transport system substrate-binding protein